jgi:hypothetical protein
VAFFLKESPEERGLLPDGASVARNIGQEQNSEEGSVLDRVFAPREEMWIFGAVAFEIALLRTAGGHTRTPWLSASLADEFRFWKVTQALPAPIGQ